MPYSQGYYSDPAQYGIRQDENRQEQFRQLLNMIVASKQMKQERKTKEQEMALEAQKYAEEQDRWNKEYGLDVQRQRAQEKYQQGQIDMWNKPDQQNISAFQEKVAAFMQAGMPYPEAVNRASGYREPTQPTEKTPPLREQPEYKIEQQWERDSGLVTKAIAKHQKMIESTAKLIEDQDAKIAIYGTPPIGGKQKDIDKWHVRNPGYKQAMDTKEKLVRDLQNAGQSLQQLQQYDVSLSSSQNPLDELSRLDVGGRYSNFNSIVKGEYERPIPKEVKEAMDKKGLTLEQAMALYEEYKRIK